MNAQVRLGYTEIAAPFNGRIGRIEFSEGDVVGPGSGTPANLTRLSPIYVTFGLAQRDLIELIQWAGSSDEELDPLDAVVVRAELPTGQMFAQEGHLVFVDNRIDPATGTIAVRAQFENPNAVLVPGMFVNVEVGNRVPQPQLTLPQAVLQQDQQGSYVLVVGEGDLLEQRYVQLGQNVGTDVVALFGVAENERVIVEGLQRVRIGVPVVPENATAPPAGEAQAPAVPVRD